jgi:phosphocarrier protein HPr
MSHLTRSQLVTINNPQGLHMRPAYMFAETAAKFKSKIELIKNDLRIDGKSVLSILTLGASQGTEVLIEATGDDANDAIDVLQDLLSSGFQTGSSSPPSPS